MNVLVVAGEVVGGEVEVDTTQSALFGMIKSQVSATSKEQESLLGPENMALVGNP